jgi:hypothetical protein
MLMLNLLAEPFRQGRPMKSLRASRGPLTVAMVLAAPISANALSTLDVDIVQTGEDCSLTWCVNGAALPNGGATLYIEGVFNGVDTGNFMGWWAAATSTLGGSVAEGWTDYPSQALPESIGYIPYPSSRFSGIFSVGVHYIVADLFTVPLDGTQTFTPDGPSFTAETTRYRTSFEVLAVPEAASTLVLIGAFASFLFVIAGAKRRESGVR